MDGIIHIQRLAKMALSAQPDDAISHIEALIRISKEKNDSHAVRLLESILIEARRRGRLGRSALSSPVQTLSASHVGPATDDVVGMKPLQYLEDPLPPPQKRPFLEPDNLSAVLDYLHRCTEGFSKNVLLTGPSGTGKTMTAAWMAGQNNKALYRLSFPRIFDSFLGKTARNLSTAFREVAERGGILFLDEVDAVLRARDAGGDHGEMQRTVNVMLMEIDHSSGHVPVFAATNLLTLVDRAVTRRFQHILKFNLPDPFLRERCIRAYCPSALPPFFVPVMIRLTPGFSYAHLENVLSKIKWDTFAPAVFWRDMIRILQQTAPSEAYRHVQQFAESTIPEQAMHMATWGVDKHVIASVFQVSESLISKWLSIVIKQEVVGG